jgi:hypothetical protein
MPYAPKKAPAKKVVVKQSTIDNIKKLGMTAALKKAGSSNNAEFVEGVKRMYGAKRLAAAKPVAKSPDAARPKAALGPTKSAPAAPRYTSKNPKPMNPKGLFPGLLSGKYKPKGSSTPLQKPTKAQIAYGKSRKA